MTDGILVHDVDAEVDTVTNEETVAVGHVDDIDEESRKNLRDHLRRTINYSRDTNVFTGSIGSTAPGRRKGKDVDLNELSLDTNTPSTYKPREYFVLTDAGKPVFTSRDEGDESGSLSSTMGIVQALLSVFLDDGDKLRCINAGKSRITFLLRTPLYYVCASSWGEPESVTRSHLEYLHLQILSIVTAAQLRRIFERRTNFDLRRLLNGAEPFLFSLLERMEFDLAIATASLHCLQMDPNLRARAADSLVPMTKIKDILYIILVAQGRVITLVRPKKHSIHPADLHILVNTIYSPSIFNSPASASWIPVCLPKFNPSGFVNAYITFLRRPDSNSSSTAATTELSSDGNPVEGSENASDDENSATPIATSAPRPVSNAFNSDASIGLVCISGGGEFETIRGWCDTVAQKLGKDGTLNSISKAMSSGKTDYSVSQLSIPGLRHFVYKSRPLVQITSPIFEEPYEDLNARRRVITLYQTLHDAIHAKSGQDSTLKLQYIQTEKEITMGWLTQPFELYIAFSPRLPKSAVIGAANAVVRWVKKEEGQLFLRDAPVF
ncbi:DUF254-domain-containing protein [Hygrophoropsis aurantiaca]|uniref:DUF254-domain-containing protein n=1 Tax=Hygrophoropsis aurantiaca TaxID=72124 RepID=A0ACB8A701_9AGAM|nr:DUF254-domain-containing protein [Hygrophoropsis aurantiaca]